MNRSESVSRHGVFANRVLETVLLFTQHSALQRMERAFSHGGVNVDLFNTIYVAMPAQFR